MILLKLFKEAENALIKLYIKLKFEIIYYWNKNNINKYIYPL